MIKTFTPSTKKTDGKEKENKSGQIPSCMEMYEPSNTSIQNILNYGRSLEVKPSQLVGHVEMLKS